MRGLNAALADNDGQRFHELLDELLASRGSTLQTGVVRISEHLRDALMRFRMDSRIAALAEKDMPDARQRLDHVVTLTEEAAHRTLELIERSLPLACEQVRANLNEVMLAQGFQDITGQIIRSVHHLIGEVEGVLDELMELHGIPRDLAPEAPSNGRGRLAGPAVPGVSKDAVTDQSAIDDLMAGLGI